MWKNSKDGLKTALALLKYDWVFDFLFSDHSESLSNVLLNNPIYLGAKLSITPSQPALLARKGAPGCSLIFIPTLVRGSITAGFEITNFNRQKSLFLNLASRNISTMVRDDHSNVMLAITKHPNHKLIEVLYSIQYSPGVRQHSVHLFRQHDFYEMLTNFSTRFDESAASDALVFHCSHFGWRQCPQCATFQSHICGCNINLTLKQGIQDIGREIENMTLHTGSYTGYSEEALFVQPNTDALISNTFAADVHVEVLHDAIERDSLAKWAMCKLLSDNPINVLRMSIPERASITRNDLVSHTTSAQNTSFSVDLADSSISELFQVVDDDILKNVKTQRHDRIVQQAVRVHNEYGSLPAMIDNFVPKQSSCDSEQNDVFGEQCSLADTHLQATQHTVDLSAVTECSSNIFKQLDIDCLTTEQTMEEGVTRGQLYKGTHEHEHQGIEAKTKRMTIRRQTVISRAIPIAPAIGAGVDIEERIHCNQRRLEVRKARNRVSAQRSNFKKKIAFQKLKDDLVDICEREAGLRKRELELRMENRRLKMAAI